MFDNVLLYWIICVVFGCLFGIIVVFGNSLILFLLIYDKIFLSNILFLVIFCIL